MVPSAIMAQAGQEESLCASETYWSYSDVRELNYGIGGRTTIGACVCFFLSELTLVRCGRLGVHFLIS